ncbi:MAG: type VI secretion system contractile sheath large subunit [Alphaproteobacteria bacterium]|nr:type VI secretion system contractile sheath large subunit [Alphaproteobacteria bacterium]
MAEKTPDTAKEQTGTLSVLEQVLQKGKLARSEDQVPYAHRMVDEFVQQILQAGDTVSNDTIAFISKRVEEIDLLLSQQLDEILHHDSFKKVEASWRGLNYLVMNTETGTKLKLRLLNASRKELQADVEKAVEFDQSTLFKHIYEEEYGTFGGNPYSALLADFEFDASAPDMSLLTKLSNIAAAAHAPLMTAAAPGMLDMDDFTSLGKPRDLAKIFEGTDKVRWRSFRQTEDSRYVVLVLPRVLMRLPYGPTTNPVDGLMYEERVDGTTQKTFVWGNAAYMFAQRITNAFALYGWTAAIRGVEGGGLVEGLPAYTFKTTDGDIALKCPTQIAITDRREKELSDLGFIALCHCKGSDKAAFFGAQTAQKPKKYNTPQANANANTSARIPYLLAASRFAHYIKVIMRDKIGSFMTKDNVQKYLQAWIAEYVLLNDDAGQGLKARYPLREARVDVFDVPGEPGKYRATVFLRPHFQLEELTASLRLVAELPPPAAG